LIGHLHGCRSRQLLEDWKVTDYSECFFFKFYEEIGYGFAGGICTCWSKLPVLLAHDLSLQRLIMN